MHYIWTYKKSFKYFFHINSSAFCIGVKEKNWDDYFYITHTWYNRTIWGWHNNFIIWISRKIFFRLSLSSCVLSIILIATWKLFNNNAHIITNFIIEDNFMDKKQDASLNRQSQHKLVNKTVEKYASIKNCVPPSWKFYFSQQYTVGAVTVVRHWVSETTNLMRLGVQASRAAKTFQSVIPFYISGHLTQLTQKYSSQVLS